MVVSESQLGEPITITEIAFERAPMGSPSVLLHNFKIALSQAAGSTIERRFAANLSESSSFQVVYSGSRVVAADGGDGRVSFVLDTPYQYSGGDLLIDLSYADIEGSMYVWSWAPEEYRLLSANSINASQGNVSPLVPVVVVIGE